MKEVKKIIYLKGRIKYGRLVEEKTGHNKDKPLNSFLFAFNFI